MVRFTFCSVSITLLTILLHSLPRVSVLLIATLWVVSPSYGQAGGGPPVDGASLGLGLNVYQGELDHNSVHDPVKYLANGNVSLHAGADRAFGNFVGELTLDYNRFTAESRLVHMAGNVLSLGAVASYRLPLLRPGLFRPFVVMGPALVVPEYYRFPERGDGYEDAGVRVIGALGVGVVIQERIRIGVVATSTDLLEGVTNHDDRDYLSFVTVGYRFDFTQQ